MSTRSATIIRQTTYYWGEQADTEELMRFYRHCDGYPEGHGLDVARAIGQIDKDRTFDDWAAQLIHWLTMCDTIEIEDRRCEHGDLEYLYVVECVMDHRIGVHRPESLPATISVYAIGWDERYNDAEKREPIFSGTAYEYIERFGNGENK